MPLNQAMKNKLNVNKQEMAKTQDDLHKAAVTKAIKTS